MSSDQATPDTMAAEAESKTTTSHIVDLLIAFRWPITIACVLLVTGLILALIDIPAIPPSITRPTALFFLVSFVVIAWLGPIAYLVNFWVWYRTATPIVIGDPDHKEVHAVLANDLERYQFTEGLPRQRATDQGAGYVVLESDEEPESEDLEAIFDTPLTEQQPSWFDLVESPEYREWKQTRIDLTEPLREAVEEKQELYADYLDRLRTQCNRLIVGVQEDLNISDVDDLQGDDWSGVDRDADLEPEGPSLLDDRLDEDSLSLLNRSKQLRGDSDD